MCDRFLTHSEKKYLDSVLFVSVVFCLFVLEEIGDLKPRSSCDWRFSAFLTFVYLPHHSYHLKPSWLNLSIVFQDLSITNRNISTSLSKLIITKVSIKISIALRTPGLGGELSWCKGKDYNLSFHWQSTPSCVRSFHYKCNWQRCLL